MWTGLSAATGTIGAMLAGTQNPGPTWHVVGTGDTNLNDVAGVLWQNDNGALAIWEDPALFNVPFLGNVFTFNTVVALPSVDPSWHVKGMGDLNGDLHPDIVFQNDNGAVAVWEMGGGQAGTTVTAMNLVNIGGIDLGPTWHVVGLRDINSDFRADVVLQNDNGSAAVWEDYTPYGAGLATFLPFAMTPSPNPNGHVWDSAVSPARNGKALSGAGEEELPGQVRERRRKPRLKTWNLSWAARSGRLGAASCYSAPSQS